MKLPDPKPIHQVIVEYIFENNDTVQTIVHDANDQADVYKFMLEITSMLEELAEQQGTTLSSFDISVYDATMTASMHIDVVNNSEDQAIEQIENTNTQEG